MVTNFLPYMSTSGDQRRNHAVTPVVGGRVCPELMLGVCVMLRLVIALAASLAREPTAVNTEPGPSTSTSSSQLMGIPSPFPHAGCASSSSGIADLIRAEPSSAPGSCSGAVSIEPSGTLHGTKCGHACSPPSLPPLPPRLAACFWR